MNKTIEIQTLVSILEQYRLNDSQSEELQKVIYMLDDGRLIEKPSRTDTPEQTQEIQSAIRTLDEVIPPPDNKMVDWEHHRIAAAWQTIKQTLTDNASAEKEERQNADD